MRRRSSFCAISSTFCSANRPKERPSRPSIACCLLCLYRLAPSVLDALKILKPETVIRWHRAGFRAYWRWKSRPRGGRPKIPREIRQLIRDMSVANPLWGTPRIHGELLKLGINVGQTAVAKYMARRRRPPSQGWKTFLRNHADGIASIDLFVVPTISFRLLYGFLILQHCRREILWLGVTAHPSAQWIACCSGRWPHRGQPAPRGFAPSIRPDLISDRDRSGLLNRSEPGAGPDFREEPLPRPTRLSKPSLQGQPTRHEPRATG